MVWGPGEQAANRKRLRDAGLCIRCQEPREHYANECDKCALKHREEARQRAGCKIRKVGGRGRPPLIPEEELK